MVKIGALSRPEYYDRNVATIVKEWYGTILAGETWVVRWSYTVPSDRKAIHAIIFGYVQGDIATSGRMAVATWEVQAPPAVYARYAEIVHYYGCGFVSYFTVTVTFPLKPGAVVRSRTTSTDTIDHAAGITALLTEFDK